MKKKDPKTIIDGILKFFLIDFLETVVITLAIAIVIYIFILYYIKILYYEEKRPKNYNRWNFKIFSN